MNRAHWHQFQVLTKRSKRLLELDSQLDWAENIWMGVTVERADYIQRIDHLRATGAHIKFLSLEPLLGPMSGLNLDGIDWVIVGGESGPGARLMSEEWVLDIRDQCIEKGVAFFFKQWGGFNKRKNGRLLEGRTWDEYPGQRMDVNADPRQYISCLTSEERIALLMNIPKKQLSQLLRDADLI
jgi:protein gp37